MPGYCLPRITPAVCPSRLVIFSLRLWVHSRFGRLPRTGATCFDRSMQDTSEGQASDLRSASSCDVKWITSLSAIVAPYPCTLVRGALVLSAPTRPTILALILFRLLTRFSVDTFTPIPRTLIRLDRTKVLIRPTLR